MQEEIEMITRNPSQDQELVVQGRKAAYCAGMAAAASMEVVTY